MATATPYGQFLISLANGEVDLNSHEIKCLITDDTYTPNRDTHRYLSDVTGEITGTNYTPGGLILQNPTIGWDTARGRFVFDAEDLLWPTVTLDGIRRAVIYDNTPATDATKPLICWSDFGADQSPTAVNFGITWDTDGIFYIQI